MYEEHKIRTAGIFLLFLVVYGLILGNLALTQLHQGGFFRTLGRRQYATHLKAQMPRAEIYDRRGGILAYNKESIAAFVFPKKLENESTFLTFLCTFFPAAYKRFLNAAGQNFFYIKRRLSDDEIDAIRRSTIADIHLLQEPSRYYPLRCAGPLTGITDVDNKGLFGIEKIFNDQLAGKPVTMMLERDARSGFFYFSKHYTVPGQEGKPITLTIDADLQFLAYEELKASIEQFEAQSGAVLVIDPSNGDILAMVNYPDFDPNTTEHLNLATTRNTIITDCHELGSVMKTFIALAALEEAVVTLDEVIDCENTKTTFINGMQINTVLAHGQIPFSKVIAGSNNIGIAKVALRLGPKLYDHYRRLGFSSLSGLGLPGEQKGIITHPSSWSKQSLFSLSYGYEISANLMQLGRALCIIARDGFDIHPRLVLDKINQTNTKRLYSSHAIKEVKKILKTTVEAGTASLAQLSGYEIMGKTGSADMLINGSYDKNRSLFTFAGIVQKGDYQRVIICFVKNVARKGLYASSVTAPLFRRIAEKMIIHERKI